MNIQFVWKTVLLLVLPGVFLNSCNATTPELPPRLGPPSSHGSRLRLADSDRKVTVCVDCAQSVGPKPIKMTRPILPAGTKKAGINTVVVLEAAIDENGNVSVLRIVRGDPILNDIAVRAVNHWKYEPAQVDGTTMKTITTITVQFRERHSR